MTDNVKNELNKTVESINRDFRYILDGILSSEKVVKIHFERIKNNVDYCEALTLRGEDAIE